MVGYKTPIYAPPTLNRLRMYGNGYSMAIVLDHRFTAISLTGNRWLKGSSSLFTEKLATGLKTNMVPLIIGSRDVSRVAPPESYIHVLDYSSPKELADYIKVLDRNDTLYKNYLKWKKDYKITIGNIRPFCRLCKFLHSNGTKQKMVIDNFNDWFFHKSNCKGNVLKLLPHKSDRQVCDMFN